jgi:membrane protein YqaA with SNARE-associated domain
MESMLKTLYDRIIVLSESPRAGWALGAVSFAEASFFPIPPDIMLVPMVVARRDQAWNYAAIATAFSVLGGLFGYAIGAFLYDTLGQWLIHFYGGGKAMGEFHEMFARYGHWIILIKGLTPIPYKIVTIAAGVAHYPLPWFIILSLITRAGRFFLVAGILYVAGPAAKDFIEKRLGMVTLAFAVLIVVGIVVAMKIA